MDAHAYDETADAGSSGATPAPKTSTETRKRNYLFRMTIAGQDLAEGKRPPLCDGCCEPFIPNEQGAYEVQALVLGNSIYGLECERCRGSFFPKIPLLEGDQVPKDALRALHGVLGRDMTVLVW